MSSKPSVPLTLAIAAATFTAVAGFAAASSSRVRVKSGSPPSIRLTYFAIQGELEKVRLALSLGHIDFTDVVVPFSEWKTMKPTTPYGQLPLMEVGGAPPMAQSYAMLRIAGRMAMDYNGIRIYADSDIEVIEEALGFVNDIERSFYTALSLGISPAKHGYEKDSDESKDAIKRVREAWVTTSLPDFMKLLTKKLEGKKFLCGDKVRGAACVLRYKIMPKPSLRISCSPRSPTAH